MQTTFERARAVVADVLSINPERIVPETQIIDELNPDSLEVVEIVIGLESEFDVSLDADQAELTTMRELVSRMEEKLALSQREIQY